MKNLTGVKTFPNALFFGHGFGNASFNWMRVDKLQPISYIESEGDGLDRMTEKKHPELDEAIEEKLDSILQPSTQAKTFKITIEFGYKISPNYTRAVDLAKRNPTYKEEGSGEWIRHSATYTPAEVEELFKLFNMVHEWESTEVLVNHKKIPYSHQLWLPLMWFYRIK